MTAINKLRPLACLGRIFWFHIPGIRPSIKPSIISISLLLNLTLLTRAVRPGCQIKVALIPFSLTWHSLITNNYVIQSSVDAPIKHETQRAGHALI